MIGVILFLSQREKLFLYFFSSCGVKKIYLVSHFPLFLSPQIHFFFFFESLQVKYYTGGCRQVRKLESSKNVLHIPSRDNAQTLLKDRLCGLFKLSDVSIFGIRLRYYLRDLRVLLRGHRNDTSLRKDCYISKPKYGLNFNVLKQE